MPRLRFHEPSEWCLEEPALLSRLRALALRYDDPAAKLAQALDIYASTGKKSAVRNFLFPKARRLHCAQHQAQR